MSRTVKRAIISEPGRVGIENIARPVPKAGEVTVRVTSCGLCGSDATMFLGHHPIIEPPLSPGHEIVGVAITGALAGRRVAVLPQVGCGRCVQCERNEARLCAEMQLIGGQIPGGAAEEIVVPSGSLVEIPDNIPHELEAIIEPLAVAAHAVTQAPNLSDTDVLVVGGGPIGVLTALVAQDAGGKVVLVEPSEPRRQMASHLNLDAVDAVPDAVYDVAFDCVGGAEVSSSLLGSIHAGGTVVLVGVAAPQLTYDGIALQRQERSLVGSHMYTRADFHRVLAMLADGLLPTDSSTLNRLFERRALEDVAGAFAALVSRNSPSLKILLVP